MGGKHSIPGDIPGKNDVDFGAGAPWNGGVTEGDIGAWPPAERDCDTSRS